MHLGFLLLLLTIATAPCHPSQHPPRLPQEPSSTSVRIQENISNPPKKLFDYTAFYNRSNPSLRPFVIVLFIVWITFLFSFVGIVASDFFCPNLSTISSRLNLSESLAGVTLLGFGNGAPDVFSTFAAFKADTGALAIGELIGASLFIVSVVVGTMSIVRPFRVPRYSFLRDLIFFIIAIVFVLIIIIDRGIKPWQANALVLIYLTYVLSVLLSSWSLQKIQSRRDQLRIARSLYAQDDQSLEPYHDDPDFPIQPAPQDSNQSPLIAGRNSEDYDAIPTRLSPQLSPHSQARPLQGRMKSSSTLSSHSDSFQSLLETSYPISVPVGNRRMRAPSISYHSNPPGPPPTNLLHSSPSSTSNSPNLSRENLSRTRSNDSPADSMASPDNLRRRPRRNTIMMNGPIRPSLLGAVEFRDVINSLARDSSVHSTIRPTSPHLAHRRPSSARRPRSDSKTHPPPASDPAQRIPPIHQPSTSSDHRINRLHEFRFEPPTQKSNASAPLGHRRSSKSADFSSQAQSSRGFEHSNFAKPPDSRCVQQNPPVVRSNSSEVGNRKSDRFQSGSRAPSLNRPSTATPLPRLPSILITTDRHEVIQLPDTPLLESSHHQHQIHPPSTRLDLHPLPTGTSLRSQQERKRRRKWKKIIGTVWETLFPTLKEWRMKSELGVFLALFSAPAVFVLTLTLPVVVDETEEIIGPEEEEDEEGVEYPADVNDIKVTQDEFNGPRVFSADRPHGGDEEQVGLGLRCVLEEEEDSRTNSAEGEQKGPNTAHDAKFNLDQTMMNDEGNEEEQSVLLRERVQEEDTIRDDDEEQSYSAQDVARILATVQTFLAPPFWVVCLVDHDGHHHAAGVDDSLTQTTQLYGRVSGINPTTSSNKYWIELVGSIIAGAMLSKVVFETLRNQEEGGDDRRPLGQLMARFNVKKMVKIALCLIGFVNSMIFILLIVNQLVLLLHFFATIFHISDSLLGLTIFGIGNSLGDFVANFTVAKMGFPVMAISACFGGPMLNILLGIGVSARIVISNQGKGGEGGGGLGKIEITSSKSLVISTVALLVILLCMLLLVPLRKSFLFDRSVGLFLISSYSFVFLINLFVESFW